MKILVVDDQVNNIRLVKKVLEKENHEILEAENGRLGVESALNEKPDLILMDLFMPEMNGYVATRELREQGYSGLIVAFTIYDQDCNPHELLDYGFDDLLPKPIDEEFQHRINEIFQRRNEETSST